jgi:hypothetical protein
MISLNLIEYRMGLKTDPQNETSPAPEQDQSLEKTTA